MKPTYVDKAGAGDATGNANTPLQQILGTGKGNPVFSLYQDKDRGKLHVYYGMELLEVVEDDYEDFSFRCLLGRLYNAGVKAKSLQECFGVDRKTMKRWGQALQRNDFGEVLRGLAGRGDHRKLSSEIRAFVSLRFGHLHTEGCRDYSQKIRREILEIFKVSLSGEALRPVFKELKTQWAQASDQPTPSTSSAGEQKRETAWEGAEPRTDSGPDCSEGTPSGRVSAPGSGAESCPQEAPQAGENADSKRATACEGACAEWGQSPAEAQNGAVFESPQDSTGEASPKEWPVLTAAPTSGSLCRHVGLLCFSALLTRITEQFAEAGQLLKQWVGTILLGAVNIEQTKWLDWKDLKRLLGSVVRHLHHQRCELKVLAGDTRTLGALMAFNARELGLCRQGGDFYVDPHTKHYTGQQNVLKGWCPRIRFADKVLHTDFIHTAEGDPIFMNWTDNFADLRQRLWAFVQRFRAQLGFQEDAVLTLIIDRAISSQDFFDQILQSASYHLITWEKNYTKGQWEESQLAGEFVIERLRNHADDKRSYHFRYMDRPWSKNPQMRQLVVVATNPEGRSIEVAVLTDDCRRPAQEILVLIFNRWLQENDFKYLDNHFGINEITSYSSVAYEKLHSQIEDRQIQSGALKALAQRQKELKARLSRLLMAEHKRPASSAKRTAEIEALTEALNQLEIEKGQVEKEASRLETLIEQGMVRLDTSNKSLMDTLKIIARNGFYELLEPFKKAYNNYRDDHELFRQFTRSDGILIELPDRVEAHLLPTPNLQPKVRKILTELLDNLNGSGLKMPDGSGRSLQLFLGEKAGIELANKNGPYAPFY